jgi:hypothetical protein
MLAALIRGPPNTLSTCRAPMRRQARPARDGAGRNEGLRRMPGHQTAIGLRKRRSLRKTRSSPCLQKCVPPRPRQCGAEAASGASQGVTVSTIQSKAKVESRIRTVDMVFAGSNGVLVPASGRFCRFMVRSVVGQKPFILPTQSPDQGRGMVDRKVPTATSQGPTGLPRSAQRLACPGHTPP